MASVSVRECIRVCRRSVRHINWQTGTAVSEVDTSNLLLQKRMPPPECASLISNLVLISSCCPLRRIRWQLLFEETFFPSPSFPPSFSFHPPSLSLSLCLSWRQPPGIKAHSHWLPQKISLHGLFSPPSCFIGSFPSCSWHLFSSADSVTFGFRWEVVTPVGRIIAVIPGRAFSAVIMGTPMIQWIGDEHCWYSQSHLNHSKCEI